MPPAPSAARRRVLDALAGAILALGPGRVRVAIDGPTAAGKTSLGHELAQHLAEAGRTVLRASLDDFKRPWSERHLYDRESGEGYYRNAFDTEAARRLLLDPAAAGGSGRLALCSIDPLTQQDHAQTRVDLPIDGVLVVDGVFALRPQLAGCWELRIWLHVDPEASLRRAIARDADRSGGATAAEALHLGRYRPAEAVYEAEVHPARRADVVVDNSDLTDPVLLRGTDARRMIADVEVREAGGKGWGVLARRSFDEGELIFRRRHLRVLSEADLDGLSAEDRMHLCELGFDRFAVLAPPGAFLNHSCDPNAMRHGVKVFAWRPIAAGAEITIDDRLNAFDGDSWPCHCGARSCTGTVVGSFFAMDDERQRLLLPHAPPFIRREHRRRARARDTSAPTDG